MGRVIHKVFEIVITYKEVYQIHCIELGCNYSLFVYTYILSIYSVTREFDISSINDMYLIVTEPKQTMAGLEPVLSDTLMGLEGL